MPPSEAFAGSMEASDRRAVSGGSNQILEFYVTTEFMTGGLVQRSPEIFF